jgi:hypothetical protein
LAKCGQEMVIQYRGFLFWLSLVCLPQNVLSRGYPVCVDLLLGQLEIYFYDYFKVGYEIQRASALAISIVWAFIVGDTGNYFYCKIAKEKVDGILKNTEEENQRIVLLKKSGGTTYLVYVVAVILIGFIFITLN